jgi:hypothetical protein
VAANVNATAAPASRVDAGGGNDLGGGKLGGLKIIE